MKIGFSTLGCPSWSWEEILASAKDLGYEGIEVRGLANKIYLPEVKAFHPENIGQVQAELNRLNLEIPCLTTGAFLFDPAQKAGAQKEVMDYLEIAQGLKVPYVRALLDKEPYPGEVDEACIRENLRELLPLAQEKGVTLLVETNGVFASSEKLAKLMEEINHPNLGIIWDVHHPFRYHAELPQLTYSRIKPWIRHIHLKDSVMEAGQVKYKMLGYGDVPVREALALLKKDDFSGYVVLEWVKRWCNDLEEPGIVFAHFINALKNMLAQS